MKQINNRKDLSQIPKANPTIFALLFAIFTATTASAQGLSTYETKNGILKKLSGDGPDYMILKDQDLVESTLWEKTKFYSSEAWDSTKDFSNKAWLSIKEFVEKGDNEAWLYVTSSGAGLAASGSAAVSTTSVLGLVTITTAPAWAPVAICAGTAVAVGGATGLLLENIDE